MKLLRVTFFFMLFLLWNVSSISAQFFEAGVQKLEKPAEAPNFRLKELGGRMISLEAFKGKIVLLHFFSPLCSVCQKQASSFDKLDEVINNKDVVFITVAVQGRDKELSEYKRKYRISVPILIDEKGLVAKAYKVRGHHETFFINRQGKIIGKAYAEKDWTSPAMTNLIHYLLVQN